MILFSVVVAVFSEMYLVARQFASQYVAANADTSAADIADGASAAAVDAAVVAVAPSSIAITMIEASDDPVEAI